MVKTSQRQALAHTFDYTLLSATQRKHIKSQTGEIRARLRRSAQDIWEIGQRLVDVRSQLKHGQFDVWIKAEFGWSRRTAYNFISVYEAFPESANFAQADIAVSALYLMAAPSTHPEFRNRILERAKQGEKITRKLVRQALESEPTTKSLAKKTTTWTTDDVVAIETCSGQKGATQPPPTQTQIVALIPNTARSPLSRTATVNPDTLQSGWHELGAQHRLFYGDTASPDFFAELPHASLVLAITTSDWAHDWIIEKADSALVLQESALPELSLPQVISTFSKPGELVIFPWLPEAGMVTIAHQLGRIVVAGDVDPKRCAETMAQFKVT